MQPQTLLVDMGKQMGIVKSQIESDSAWIHRIILSACSGWFVSVLTDMDTGNSDPSVIHVKSKVREKLSAYIEIFCDDLELSQETIDNITQYIYDVHENAGTFYHYLNHVRSAVEKHDKAFGVEWIRNPSSFQTYTFSGLGIYQADCLKASKAEEDIFQFYENYGLPKESPNEILRLLIERGLWVPFIDSSDKEYLNIYRKYGEKYYTNKKPKVNDYLLAHAQTENIHRYMIVNGNNQYELAEWEMDEGYHQYAALALMCKYQPLQAEVIMDADLVVLKLDYLLSQKEEDFLRLYAWPVALDSLSDRWNFSMMPAVYPAIRQRLIHLGFKIKEKVYE